MRGFPPPEEQQPLRAYPRTATPGGPYETLDDDVPLTEPADDLVSTPHAPVPLSRRFYLKLDPPHLTYAIIAANLIAFALAIWVGWSRFGILNGFESIEVLVILGAKVNPLIVAGQWWRLFTAMFLHVGILHLVFNMYAIFAIGPLVEGYYGHLRFALIYLIGGLFGSLASFAFSPTISAGASGAVFALAAAVAVYFFRYRENFGARGRAMLQNMLVVLGANLVFGMVSPGIDNWGHVGGMVGGLIMGWALLPRYSPPMLVGNVAEVPIVPDMAPARVLLAAGAAGAFLWLGTTAASAHWVCGSWLGC